MKEHKVVSQEEWLAARDVRALRRWAKVSIEYVLSLPAPVRKSR